MGKEKSFISAVVYVHNDADVIAPFLRRLTGLLEANFEHAEIICVNDFSTDGSLQAIREVRGCASCVALSVINLSHFHGLEIAMNAGVDLSIGDYILELDTARQTWADEEILRVYRMVLEGNDIVSASPDSPQKLSSTLFYWLYNRFSDAKTLMHTESFRILSRRAVNRISGMSRTLPYRKGVYMNCGLQAANVRYAVTAAPAPEKTRQQQRYRRDLAFETLILFTDAGYFVTKLMTTLMMLVSLFMIAYTVVIYASSNPVEGWTTTILFLSVAFFGLFAILTVIVKYLQILVKLTFRKTKYSYESIEKLTA